MAKIEARLGFEKMLQLLPYVEEMEQDEELAEAKQKLKELENPKNADFIRLIFPVLIKKHTDAILAIYAIETGCTEDEAEHADINDVLGVLSKGLNTKVNDFLPFAVRLAASV